MRLRVRQHAIVLRRCPRPCGEPLAMIVHGRVHMAGHVVLARKGGAVDARGVCPRCGHHYEVSASEIPDAD